MGGWKERKDGMKKEHLDRKDKENGNLERERKKDGGRVLEEVRLASVYLI